MSGFFSIKRLLSHPVFLVIFSIISLLFYFSLVKSDQKLVLSRSVIQNLETDITQLENEITGLEDTLSDASGSSLQEKIIRDELLMQKPGEYVVQLPSLAELAPEPSPSPTPQPWDEWRKVLF